jgi:hypothetical protein
MRSGFLRLSHFREATVLECVELDAAERQTVEDRRRTLDRGAVVFDLRHRRKASRAAPVSREASGIIFHLQQRGDDVLRLLHDPDVPFTYNQV